MPLPVPNLDDRKFQDILDEARRLIPRYCPEWTDHNLSDPGITLLELFAWMTEMLLYRLNRVPDKNYVKFLELIGVRLQPARAARAELMFRLTAPQPADMVIAAHTAVATVRTETSEAITFATDRDLTIRVPRLVNILAARGGLRFNDYRPAIDNPQQGLGIFSERPQPDDGLYLGFANDLSGHTLAITLRCRIEGIGVDPRDPPLAWETWDGLDHHWVRVDLEQDGTGGLNRDGLIILTAPVQAAPVEVDGKVAFWIRCRVLRPRPNQNGYSDSPRVMGVSVESLGGSVPASHGFAITGEELDPSTGSPGQRVQLHTMPVLPRQAGETLQVENDDGELESWLEVGDFGSSGASDPHFVLDDVTGTIELGPCIRTPDGVEHQYGRALPQGRRMRFSSYRSGGGLIGNVGARMLRVLKSSIPYVAWVVNPHPAIGGVETEDLEHAKWRGPQVLRARDRAVTAEDYELLAREASTEVGRAHCAVAHDPGSAPVGVVRLQLVPAVGDATGPLPADQLQVTARVRQQVQEFLDERRPLTSELAVEPTPYIWVRVDARVRALPRASRERVASDARAALYRYVHPTLGGPDGTGWPFERSLFVGEIYSLLQPIDGVDAIEDVALYQIDPTTREPSRPTTRITPGSDGLLCSDEHRVTFA